MLQPLNRGKDYLRTASLYQILLVLIKKREERVLANQGILAQSFLRERGCLIFSKDLRNFQPQMEEVHEIVISSIKMLY